MIDTHPSGLFRILSPLVLLNIKVECTLPNISPILFVHYYDIFRLTVPTTNVMHYLELITPYPDLDKIWISA